MITIVYMVIGVLIGILFGYGIKIIINKRAQEKSVFIAGKLINDAKVESSNIIKDAQLKAKDTIYTAKAQGEAEAKERLKEITFTEKRLVQREDMLDKKLATLDDRDQEIKKTERELSRQLKQVEQTRSELKKLRRKEIAKLEGISGMSSEWAKKALMETLENEARHDAAKKIKQIIDEAMVEADGKAKEILATAIQRYSADVTSERTVSVVNLPSEEMKGRIIGREGRNIRSIEAITGVDLIVDDTPDAVIVSSFDPVKREIARLSLKRLVVDGRIHPSRIEEVVEKVKQEMADDIWQAGQKATFDIGGHGINPEIIKLLGKLKYRTSFAQNVYQHSIEVAHLCGIIAAELGVNQKIAKRIGLLHDIGKAIDHEVEGSHAIIGAEILKRYGESNEVTDAVASHHNEIPINSVFGFLVQAADSLSAARPGARQEMLENYIKRLTDLEKIAGSFKGIGRAYAIQAGREVRVMVDVKQVSDDDMELLAQEIGKAIEKNLTYPGQIKVVVIRENRAIGYAK
jgi:ribonuclease Y